MSHHATLDLVEIVTATNRKRLKFEKARESPIYTKECPILIGKLGGTAKNKFSARACVRNIVHMLGFSFYPSTTHIRTYSLFTIVVI